MLHRYLPRVQEITWKKPLRFAQFAKVMQMLLDDQIGIW